MNPTKILHVVCGAKIKITWAGVPTATSYRVKRDDGTGFRTIAEVQGDYYIDENVTEWKSYSYLVTVLDGRWESGPSNRVTARI